MHQAAGGSLSSPWRSARASARIGSPLVVLLAMALLTGAAAAACSSHKPRQPEAIIVDELSITDPGKAFVDHTVSELAKNGYHVDYVPPQDVYVDFFEHLPKYNSSIVIIRSHSFDATINGDAVSNADVGLFTSQPYSKDAHVDQQRAGEALPAHFFDREEAVYFGLGPDFFRKDMKGRFAAGTTIIVMGCNSLSNDSLAQAFIAKGAANFIGWDDQVTANFTDMATARLITHLVTEGMSPRDAVAKTSAEVGADPVYGGKLMLVQAAGSS